MLDHICNIICRANCTSIASLEGIVEDSPVSLIIFVLIKHFEGRLDPVFARAIVNIKEYLRYGVIEGELIGRGGVHECIHRGRCGD
jgi:hypothetical protein